jgi:sortase (surface protein transpeptidase)
VLTSGPVEPVRLAIPAIGVDAPIVPVGLEPDGSMEVPAVDRAGWYHPTAVWPGMPAGSSVLAAHVDYGGRRGVFFDLRRVPVGAEVWVLDGQGRARRFVVDTRFQIDKDALASHDLFRVDGSPTLTLITCGGAFDSRSRHYQDNIVVQASPA